MHGLATLFLSIQPTLRMNSEKSLVKPVFFYYNLIFSVSQVG